MGQTVLIAHLACRSRESACLQAMFGTPREYVAHDITGPVLGGTGAHGLPGVPHISRIFDTDCVVDDTGHHANNRGFEAG